MLKQKLKANRELAVRPIVQRARTPAMSGLPVHKGQLLPNHVISLHVTYTEILI